jgi:hypothetical protein
MRPTPSSRSCRRSYRTQREPECPSRPVTPAAWSAPGKDDWGRAGVELYYTGHQELEDNPYRSVSQPHFVLGFLVDRWLGRFRVFLNAENILGTRQRSSTRCCARPRPRMVAGLRTCGLRSREGRSTEGCGSPSERDPVENPTSAAYDQRRARPNENAAARPAPNATPPAGPEAPAP